MSDFGPGPTAQAEPDSPGSDSNVTTIFRDEQGRFTGVPDPIGLALSTGAIETATITLTEDTIVSDPIPTVDPTPEEVTKNVSAFMGTLQFMANSVVKASEFAQELRVLRAEFDALKHEVEVYRETNARLDEEVSRLREERMRLQDENAALRTELDYATRRADAAEGDVRVITADRDRIQSDWREVRLSLSDANRQVRDLEEHTTVLEEQLRIVTAQRDRWELEAHQSRDKLERIKAEIASVPQAA